MADADSRQYYRPWDLGPDEEQQIKGQIEDIERLIERELAESDMSDPAHTTSAEEPHVPQLPQDSAAPPQPDEMNATVDTMERSDVAAEGKSELEAVPDREVTNDAPAEDVPAQGEKKVEDRPQDDHGGEELVEGQEDDVIY